MEDPSLSLEPINPLENFETIKKLVQERLYAVELWETYFRCVQVSKIKNQKEVYYHQLAQINKLHDLMRHIVWNRQEFLTIPTPDVTPIYTLLENCHRFEFNVRVLTFD